jgi:hypothetical protein
MCLQATMVGSCEYGKESSDIILGGEFLDSSATTNFSTSTVHHLIYIIPTHAPTTCTNVTIKYICKTKTEGEDPILETLHLNELCFWTLSIVWSLKNKQNWGIKNTDKISQYTLPKKIPQGSITNHRATYLGAHTHTPLKQVRHRWQ